MRCGQVMCSTRPQPSRRSSGRRNRSVKFKSACYMRREDLDSVINSNLLHRSLNGAHGTKAWITQFKRRNDTEELIWIKNSDKNSTVRSTARNYIKKCVRFLRARVFNFATYIFASRTSIDEVKWSGEKERGGKREERALIVAGKRRRILRSRWTHAIAPMEWIVA